MIPSDDYRRPVLWDQYTIMLISFFYTTHDLTTKWRQTAKVIDLSMGSKHTPMTRIILIRNKFNFSTKPKEKYNTHWRRSALREWMGQVGGVWGSVVYGRSLLGLFRGLEPGSSSWSLKSFILRLEYSNQEYLIFNEYLFIFIKFKFSYFYLIIYNLQIVTAIFRYYLNI